MSRFIHPRQLLCHNKLKCQNKQQYIYIYIYIYIINKKILQSEMKHTPALDRIFYLSQDAQGFP